MYPTWREPVKKLWVLINNKDSFFFKKAGIIIGVPKKAEIDKEADGFLVEFPQNHEITAFGNHEIVFF
ncbi:MAG: hypothetical protein A2Y98_02020 [Candidatus Portnoybacteria bacterium RBG_19FT_COMBO_36_7]|uniref:Uncharacterized protein n=1 Tax=Candidatus Portnoybacteria bacterium RBG_19FT_COMBO_36_7 TaxID=1801992 RepID=A0A1G2F8J9_9BACT|nr:MAG: hypothetical protein A2Y98_02020 [Candidatus Portnoybacteria bacterium RBG_19FT_COMBO_36_7]